MSATRPSNNPTKVRPFMSGMVQHEQAERRQEGSAAKSEGGKDGKDARVEQERGRALLRKGTRENEGKEKTGRKRAYSVLHRPCFFHGRIETKSAQGPHQR